MVRALLQIAGADAGQPPPEILGTALQASGELDSERVVADLFLLPRKSTQSLMSWITFRIDIFFLICEMAGAQKKSVKDA